MQLSQTLYCSLFLKNKYRNVLQGMYVINSNVKIGKFNMTNEFSAVFQSMKSLKIPVHQIILISNHHSNDS